MLDAAGFPDAKIVASNDLDETLIASLVEQGARIDTYGVGTKLVTAFDQPALGGVYKLGAVKEGAFWRDVIKVSEQPIKISNPGRLQIMRFRRAGELVADIIFDDNFPRMPTDMFDIENPTRPPFKPDGDIEYVLQPFLEKGESVRAPDSLATARARAATQLGELSPRTKRFLNPQPYPVGLDRHVHERKLQLIEEARDA